MKESKLEISEQTTVVDESVKMFLEELVTNVCKPSDETKEEHEELKKDWKDLMGNFRAEEQPADVASSDTACCDDDEENVLSDEALNELDKELEAESSDRKDLDDINPSVLVNEAVDPDTHGVQVENYGDSVPQETDTNGS